jgi:ABC-type lipoprotein export system ATPase subunit
MEILRSQLNKTIIMVTHDPKAAARAQRILHLEKGALVLDTASPLVPTGGLQTHHSPLTTSH